MSNHYTKFMGIILLLVMTAGLSMAQESNFLPNGDLETIEPGFWTKMNGTTELIWATDTSVATHNDSRSLKIVKAATTADPVGWQSVNNANLYWNHAGSDGADAWTLSFTAKTEGVNTAPADDDAKIGVLFTFMDGETVLGTRLVPVDQTSAATFFTEYSDAITLTGTPDDVTVEVIMGKDATGTVWFDNINCNTNTTWTMGLFNGNCETPKGWMAWASGGDVGFASLVHMADSAHSGEYAALLAEEDDLGDEMVFYSAPVPATENKWYKLGFWAKAEGVNTDTTFMASGVAAGEMGRDNGRIGITFFYHKGPIETGWDLVGGDQFVYIDQRLDYSTQDWKHYTFVSKAPTEAAGVSIRARFTSFPTGKVWYDDFTIEEFSTDPNVIVNGDLEDINPAFWEKMNGTTELIWASDTSVATHNDSRSLKIVKEATTADPVGWMSVNNANLYWNHAGSDGADAWTLSFTAKTEGVNTAPADDDAKIGVLFTFMDGETVLGTRLVPVDQTTAATFFTEYSDAITLTGTPDDVTVKLIMGKNATGTVWFDNINCNTNTTWTMGLFNGNCETPVGWMAWASGGDVGFASLVHMADSAHSGEYAALLAEEDGLGDEMVFYSEPGVAEEGEYYYVSFYTKTEGMSTKDSLMNSAVIGGGDARDNDRIGITFFFHKGPIETGWDLPGGDQYIYIDQRPGLENQDWTLHTGIAMAPLEAEGVSIRARFTSFPTGKVWYDDFSVQKVFLVFNSIEDFGPNGVTIASDYRLENNYPNPFNPLTHIEFYVPKAGNIEMAVYNSLGQKIRTLVSGAFRAGNHYTLWDGTNDHGITVASGMYFYQLRGANSVITKKMHFIK